jgi:hypothetical protein
MTTEALEQRIVALTKERDWWRGVAENNTDAGSSCRCEACNARQCYAPQRMDARGIPGIDDLRCALPHGLPPVDPEEGERWLASWPQGHDRRELPDAGWHIYRNGKWQKEEA